MRCAPHPLLTAVQGPQDRAAYKPDDHAGAPKKRAKDAERDCTFNYVPTAASASYGVQLGICKLSHLTHDFLSPLVLSD